MPGIPAAAKDISVAVIASAIAQAMESSEIAKRLQNIDDVLSSHEALEALCYLAKLNQPDISQIVNVPVASGPRTQLKTFGRKYMMLFVPVGSTAVSFQVPGLAATDMTLIAGWNELNFPDGTTIYMTSAINPVDMLLRCSNTPFAM